MSRIIATALFRIRCLRPKERFGTRVLLSIVFAWAVFGDPIAESTIRAQAPADSPPKAARADDEAALRVRVLLRRLDSNVLVEREQAEQDLIALGPAILPLLPKPDETTSAELQTRLARIRTALFEAQTKSLAAVRRVSLSFDDRPLHEALKEIARATKNDVVVEGVGSILDHPVSLDLQNVTFWEGVDRVLDEAMADLYPYAPAGTLQVVERQPGQIARSRRAVYVESFRLEPTQVIAARSLANPGNNSLRLDLQVSWEPRLRPVNIWLPGESIEAYDEHGGPFPKPAVPIRPEIPVAAGVAAVELTVPLSLPPRRTQQIARLKGELGILLSGNYEDVRLSLRSIGKTTQHGDVQLTLQDVREADEDVYEVGLLIRMKDAQGGMESHFDWVSDFQAHLEAGERRVELAGLESTLPEPNTIAATAVFVLEPNESIDDYDFVIRLPTGLLKTTLPFELRAIDLP
ncbi:hypothetical protein JCM19992_32470 [Thermostilla marina]